MSVVAQFAPSNLKSGDWKARREALGDAVVDTIAAYAPNLKSLVAHRQVLTPRDLEETYGLTGGHVFHGENALDQIFTMRPLLGWAQYRTPVRGPLPLRLGHASRAAASPALRARTPRAKSPRTCAAR